MTLAPRIVVRPAFAVVGLQIRTAPMSPEIPALWPRFVPRIGEIAGLLEPRVSYGVMKSFDRQRSLLDYLAAVSVSSSSAAAAPPAGMVRLEIAEATYAVFASPLSELSATFGFIYNTWLPGSAFVQRDAPTFERYDEAFDPGNRQSRVEIHIPLQPKA